MPVRCSYCSHSFNLSRDYIGAILPDILAQKQKTHAVECPNCRKHIKIPVAQMKRFAPAPATAPEATEEEAAQGE